MPRTCTVCNHPDRAAIDIAAWWAERDQEFAVPRSTTGRKLF